MTISQLANYLSLHPYFKSLNDNQKFIAISRAWNQILANKKQKVEIITFSNTDITFPSLYIYKQPRLSLGLTELIDSYMSEDLFLQDLTEEQRFMVYNIAQSKVERNHNLLNDQHYKINTFKEDIILRTPLIYTPALKLRKKILEATIRVISFIIPLSLRAEILDLIRKTITFIPPLRLIPKFIAETRKLITFIPTLAVRVNVLIGGAFMRTIQFIPGLNVTADIIIGTIKRIYFTPSLTVQVDIIGDVDYTEEIYFTPSLTLTVTVIPTISE